MGNPPGVKRDFEALERRRLRAARLLQKGLRQAEVARRVGVHRQSVSRWARHLAASGRAALKQAGRAGRPSRLSADDLRRLEQTLKQGPEALGYSTSLWTAGRVAEWIRRECGIPYHPRHVWWILRRLGWSCHRPAARARARQEQERYQQAQRRSEGKMKMSASLPYTAPPSGRQGP